MPEIPDIGDVNIQIKDLNILPVREVYNYSTAIPTAPPVVVNIGLPVVDVPGCVEAHEANNKSKSLQNDDEKGLVTYCDSGLPSYAPIDYSPENLTITTPAPLPKVDSPEESKGPDTSDTTIPPTPPSTAKVDCPTPAQKSKEPVDSYVEGFRKKVVGYKLMGNECVQITEAVPIPQQIVAGLPSGGQVVQVGGVAVIATASALLAKPLADILLKVVKPTIKKVMKKIAAIRGKKLPILSVKDRRDEQRIRSHAIRKLKGKE